MLGLVALPDRVQKTAVLVPVGNRDLDLVPGLFLDSAWLFAGDREAGLPYSDQNAIGRLFVSWRWGLWLW